MPNASELIEKAQSEQSVVQDHLRDGADWFHEREGTLVPRSEAAADLADTLDVSDAVAHKVIQNLVADLVDPVIQVYANGTKHVGVIEFHAHSTWYEYVDYDDVNGRARRGVCAQCVHEAERDDEVAHATTGRGSVPADADRSVLRERLENHFATEHPGVDELDVETGATLVSGTTIASNTAWHAGNDGAGSGLDADTLDGEEPGAFADAAHASTHEDGGADEIAHNNLALAPDDHHAKYTNAEAKAAAGTDLEDTGGVVLSDALGLEFSGLGATSVSVTDDGDGTGSIAIQSTDNDTTDHGAMSGLAADDHPHYMLADGSRAFTGAVEGVAPIAGQDLATKNYVDSNVQGLDWQESVIAQQNSPPGTVAEGDRYVVGASPSGAFDGHANEVAEYNGSGWDFFAPNEGFATFFEDADDLYVYNGNVWVTFGSTLSHDSLQNVSTDDHHARYTDGEAQAAVNADADHGATADHDYFSGDHDDLTGVSASDHHTKTTTLDELVDSDLEDITVDVEANRPAAGTSGRAYIESDRGRILYDNGATWVVLGVASHDALADVSPDDHHARYTDGEAEAAINADADHGSTASHNYFSGSHDDLTDVSANDHHTRPTAGTGIVDAGNTFHVDPADNERIPFGTDDDVAVRYSSTLDSYVWSDELAGGGAADRMKLARGSGNLTLDGTLDETAAL